MNRYKVYYVSGYGLSTKMIEVDCVAELMKHYIKRRWKRNVCCNIILMKKELQLNVFSNHL